MSEWRKFNVLIGDDINTCLLESNLMRAKESMRTYKYNEDAKGFVVSSKPIPYIIMNYDTFQKLWLYTTNCEVWEDFNNMYIMSYKEYKIFIDDDLEFGEVELR